MTRGEGLPVHYQIFDPSNPMHLECAEVLVGWRQIHHDKELARANTADDVIPAMLPLDLDAHAVGIMVFEAGDSADAGAQTLRSYNAVRDVYYDDRAIEIGGLITEPAEGQVKEKRGWAWAVKPQLYRVIGERWPGWRMLIFANAKSLRMNAKMGFTAVSGVLPAEALAACKGCPNFARQQEQGRTCCDTQIELEATPENLKTASDFAIASARRYGINI
ncbi:hypothetical protein KC992_03520 [Candidatus Saccharibacteria bacterium]|nr:hypothetical protein [Candidatus Saccharibacteria bacterium]MCA9328622.1 hypothetical protein [Candidatus Saccharibacteria bacterium]